MNFLRQAIRLLALDIDKSKLNTLWYENEDGDKFVPDLEGNMPPDVPEGYKYQVSQFPTSLRTTYLKLVDPKEVAECPHPEEYVHPTHGWIDGVEGRECDYCGGTQTKNVGEEWPEEWDASGSSEVMAGESGWSEDLALAMTNSGDYTLSEAILVAAQACERCMNALADQYGLDWGYPEFSDEWYKANTQCEFCTTEEEWQEIMDEINEESAEDAAMFETEAGVDNMKDIKNMTDEELEDALDNELIPGELLEKAVNEHNRRVRKKLKERSDRRGLRRKELI